MVYIGLVVLLGSLVIGVPVCFSFLLAAIYYVIAGGYELTFITNNIYVIISKQGHIKIKWIYIIG